MYRADGRKIQRAIQVDIDSIRFCTPQMIKRPKQLELIREYRENIART